MSIEAVKSGDGSAKALCEGWRLAGLDPHLFKIWSGQVQWCGDAECDLPADVLWCDEDDDEDTGLSVHALCETHLDARLRVSS